MAKENKPKILEKSYFDVKIETMLPSTLIYRVLAESPEQAIQLIKQSNPVSVKYRLPGKKDLKITVYDAGTNMLRFLKNLISG